MSGVNTIRRTKSSQRAIAPQPLRCRPDGFSDETYVDWERDYKWRAHETWSRVLSRSRWRNLLKAGEYKQIADHAVRIESRTNLLFSFEKMALRDAVRTQAGAKLFAVSLYDYLYGAANLLVRFERWCDAIDQLPRKQTRVLTWPIVTVFPFIAHPDQHMFLKPIVTMNAAEAYGFPFDYMSRPNWDTYASLLGFAETVRKDQRDLRPKDMIDLQSFIWVQGSDEYVA